MWLIRLYMRVLLQLGSDMRIGAVLALANIGLAIAAFAEPVLFGRIIDRLTGGGAGPAAPVTLRRCCRCSSRGSRSGCSPSGRASR